MTDHPKSIESRVLREALARLYAVIVQQNRLGAKWHPEVFAEMMDGLGAAKAALGEEAARSALAGIPRNASPNVSSDQTERSG